jgi:hypothetical protein
MSSSSSSFSSSSSSSSRKIHKIPPIYTKYPQFDEFCSCGRQIGILQRDFERMESQFLSEGFTLEETRIKILKFFKIEKICCMRDATYFPRDFICDTTSDAYLNTTDSTKGKNFKMGNKTKEVGFEFLTKTNDQWGFDRDAYCQTLLMTSSSTYDKIRSNVQRKPPEFCNFKITEVIPFPLMKPNKQFPDF